MLGQHRLIIFYVTAAMICLVSAAASDAQELVPGKTVEITFAGEELPDSILGLSVKQSTVPSLSVRLPKDYDREKRYPLLVYLPDRDGGTCGDIQVAADIAGSEEWIIASLPLFKSQIDRSEPYAGTLVGFCDYPALSRAYGIMLGKLFERVPNIDAQRSALVGFSNGAFALAVLVACHDRFVIEQFKNFCFVEQGMFHIADLHKSGLRGCRFLFLVGEADPGADLKLRQTKVLLEMAGLLGLDMSCCLMKDTGHAFPDFYRKQVGRWLAGQPLEGLVWKAAPSPETRQPPQGKGK